MIYNNQYQASLLPKEKKPSIVKSAAPKSRRRTKSPIQQKLKETVITSKHDDSILSRASPSSSPVGMRLDFPPLKSSTLSSMIRFVVDLMVYFAIYCFILTARKKAIGL